MLQNRQEASAEEPGLLGRTEDFSFREVGAMEGFRKKRDLAGLQGCRREASVEAETHGEATVTVQ